MKAAGYVGWERTVVRVVDIADPKAVGRPARVGVEKTARIGLPRPCHHRCRIEVRNHVRLVE